MTRIACLMLFLAVPTLAQTPQQKRDPFQPPASQVSKKTKGACSDQSMWMTHPRKRKDVKAEQPAPSRWVACRYDVDSLRMVALVTGTGAPFAVVVDPAGNTHRVRRDSEVGEEGGKVIRLDSEGLEIEYAPDGAAKPIRVRLSVDDEA